jgi:hypothetical protein
MNRTKMNSRARKTSLALAATALAAALIGCSSAKQDKDAEKECVDPPAAAADKARKTVKVERFGLGRAGEEDKESKDWCRACVMSKIGYASCQRVFAAKPDEPRESLKARARDKACVDAKFPVDACPDQAVISNVCKGEPPPAGTTDQGTALQNLYKALQGDKPPADKPSAAEQPAPPEPGEKDQPEPTKK